MMRIWRILGAIAGAVALAGPLGSAPASAMSGASAAAAELQVWVGHWNTKGESSGTPWHADTRCAWSPNREFVVCDQLINDRVNQLMILTYDESAKVYRISSIGKDRAPVIARGTIRGKVWTNIGDFDQGGKKILIKTIVDFSVPRHYADREWTSVDGGTHWSETSRGQAIQVGAGP